MKNLMFWSSWPLLLHDNADLAGGAGGGGALSGDGAEHTRVETGDHPDFTPPIGDGTGDEGVSGGNPPAIAGAQPPAGQPQGAGAGGGQPAGGRQPEQPRAAGVPDPRLEAVIRRNATDIQRLTDENTRFRSLIANALGITDPNAPAGPKPLNDREKQMRGRLYELIPELKVLELLKDKGEALVSLADQVPQMNDANKRYWGSIAKTFLSAVEEAVAPVYLGDGKKGADLSKEQKLYFQRGFFQWLSADPARQDRYENLDRALVDEYRADVDANLVQPIARRFGAQQLNRGRQTANLPVGGGGSAPAQTPNQQPKALDEDAAADRAWAEAQRLAGANA